MTTKKERTKLQAPDLAAYSLWSVPREAWLGKQLEQLEALTSSGKLGVKEVGEISGSTEARIRSFETQIDENVLRIRVD